MDRMRAGLTGLGLVFVVTVAASAIVAGNPRQPVPEKTGEPLAQLGVAPGPEKEKAAALARDPAESPAVALPVAPAPPAPADAVPTG